MEKTITKKVRLDKSKSARSLYLQYADERSEEPGELTFLAVVRARGGDGNAVEQRGYVGSHGSLSAEEYRTLKQLLEKMFDKAVADEGFAETT